jgi:hypothetical protein
MSQPGKGGRTFFKVIYKNYPGGVGGTHNRISISVVCVPAEIRTDYNNHRNWTSGILL